MTDSSEASDVYRPFPSFTEWELGGFESADFERYSQLLTAAKECALPETLEAAMTAARRYAAVDTGAIEGLYSVDRGFTRTIATQAAAWESIMDSRGAHIRPAFDAALNGYEYVLDAATQAVDVTELWIKELHAIICASQDTYTVFTDNGPLERPLLKGTYKTMPNSPTLLDGRVHAYAPVIDTVPEMQRLVDELRSEAFMSAHRVLQAAYAHYAYVCIHPFPDGNGRVARALSSVYLYRSPGVPLIVFADQRNEYYDALESADKGHPFPFLHFIMTRTIDTIGIIRSMLQRSGPPLASTLAGLSTLFDSGAENQELQAAGLRLTTLAVAEATSQLNGLSLPTQLKVFATSMHLDQVPPPPGYSPVGNDGSWLLQATSSWPHKTYAKTQVAAFVKSSEDAASELLMASRPDDGLEVWLRELVPVESETLKLKLAAWVEGKIAELLAEAAKHAEHR